jgi:hypothetical protein
MRGKGCQNHANNNNSGVPALSREDRKNEQIMRMIERQENLLKRREKKKQGIPVSYFISSPYCSLPAVGMTRVARAVVQYLAGVQNNKTIICRRKSVGLALPKATMPPSSAKPKPRNRPCRSTCSSQTKPSSPAPRTAISSSKHPPHLHSSLSPFRPPVASIHLKVVRY